MSSVSLNTFTPPSIADMLEQFRSSPPKDDNMSKRKSFLPTTLQYSLSLANAVGDSSSPGTPNRRFKKFKLNEEDEQDLYVTPQELEGLKKKLNAAETEIEKLEIRNDKLHHLRQELEAVFTTEKNQLIAQRLDDKAKIRELEVKLTILRKRESRVKEELLRTEADKTNLNSLHTNSVKEYTTEIGRLKRHIDEVHLTHEGKTEQYNMRIEALEKDVLEMRGRHAEWRVKEDEMLEQLTSLATEQHRAAVLQLQLNKVTDKLKEAEETLENGKKAREAVLAQHQKLLQISELEKDLTSLKEENARLWVMVENKILLAEKYEHLQVQLAGHDELERDLRILEVAHSNLAAQNGEWLAMAQENFPEASDLCVEKVRELVRKLLCDEAVRVSRQGELESLCKQEQRRISKLTGDLNQLTQSYETQQTAKTQLTDQMKRLHKRLLLVTKERDSYRGLLDSMEGEMTIGSPLILQQQLQDRVQKLEEMLEEYRDILGGQENTLGRKSSEGPGREKLRKENAELSKKLEQVNGELQERSESLERLQLELEHRVLKGDFNPASTKIMHFKMNPAAVKSQEYENNRARLQQECDSLRERVRLLEDGQVSDLTRTVEASVSASNLQDIQGLREQAKSFDLRQQRMKEAFKKTSQEYREVCYMLLGFKIDRLDHSQYRLTSMYAENAEEYLIFKLVNGELNMLETPYSGTLEESIELYLRQQHSIPMFLNSITQEGLNRQTILQLSTT